jgi:ArsR family transcriptional regulator
MIYSLPTHPSAELEANLKCLQDCVQTHRVFKEDLRRLKAMRLDLGWLARRREMTAEALRDAHGATGAKSE